MGQDRRQNSKSSPRYLIVSAWPPELEALHRKLPSLPAFVRGCAILDSVGVGLVEAALGTARAIREHRPKAIVLVGSAGAYPSRKHKLALGSVVIARGIHLAVQILPGKHAYLPSLLPNTVVADPLLADTLRLATQLPLADVACPLGISASTLAANTAGKRSGCAVENLEAFAVARASAAANLPFAAVLGISNQVGPAGHRAWLKHGKQATEGACQAVLALLQSGGPIDPNARR